MTDKGAEIEAAKARLAHATALVAAEQQSVELHRKLGVDVTGADALLANFKALEAKARADLARLTRKA